MVRLYFSFVQIQSALRFLYEFSEHAFNHIHGKVNLCPLDTETGYKADGVLAGREEKAPKSCGIDKPGGHRSVLEGDSSDEASTTNGGRNERRESRWFVTAATWALNVGADRRVTT